MTYYALGAGALDYLPCRYGTSKLLFRGPRRPLKEPYIAFLGGTETYGKFIANPFPELIEQSIGRTCVNLGCVNAGVDVFATDPQIVKIASGADVTVLQLMGAHNMSNRFYTVHPRRKDRFLKPSTLLQRSTEKWILRSSTLTNICFIVCTRCLRGVLIPSLWNCSRRGWRVCGCCWARLRERLFCFGSRTMHPMTRFHRIKKKTLGL
jgi:hypothetical protein